MPLTQQRPTNPAERAAYDAGLERGRRFDGKQHIYGEDQIRIGWGLYRSGRADDRPPVKRAYFAGFRAAGTEAAAADQPAPVEVKPSLPVGMNVIVDDVEDDNQVRARAAQLPPPRENPPDVAVAAIAAMIHKWGAYWTIQAMLTALANWGRTAPVSQIPDVAEHGRMVAIRKVVNA
jgi:hypothetical protein